MKKTILLLAGLIAFTALHAQWVNNPSTNTFLNNTSASAGEVILSTYPVTGDTYIQWMQSASNGWSPSLQRVNFEGVPQWGINGIHPSHHQFSSMSEGVAMTATTDGCVVSCFATNSGYTYALKLNASGGYEWGEEGLQLFDGNGFSRTEVIAGNDGGVWALGFDYTNLYLQYIDANGTQHPTVTIHDNGGQKCMYGQLTLGNDNNVFVTYEKLGNGMYTDKEIFVAGYAVNGTQISPETKLMSSQSFQSTYYHRAVSDGDGGGYAYIWHPGIGSAFNTYVFHFDATGTSTIESLDGVPVHSADPSHYYLDAYATVDPVTHDLIIAYIQTDASTQSQNNLYVNRIDSYGDRIWNEGKLVASNGTNEISDILVDAFEYGDGFAIIYNEGGHVSTVQAKGFDEKGIALWTTSMSSQNTVRYMCDNSTGFINGQNVVAWINSNSGGLYGQNIGQGGEMGEITPPTPPAPCFAPSDFTGQSVYDAATQTFGAELMWTAPEDDPLYYHLYREDLVSGETALFEIDGTVTSYYDVAEIGDYMYQLTALYEDCESNFALTPDGENYIWIEVTSIAESISEEIVTVLQVYTMTGQLIQNTNPDKLSQGVYIVQGLTPSGKLVSKKVMVE